MLNLLSSTLLILHGQVSEVSPLVLIPCQVVLTVYQEEKSSDFVFESVQRLDALYLRLKEILHFERVAAAGKNYKLYVSFGDYLSEKAAGFAPSEKLPRRENFEPNYNSALDKLKFYLPLTEDASPRQIELRLLLNQDSLQMQAYNLRDEVLRKIEDRANAIVNWARLKSHQRRSIAFHNLGIPILGPLLRVGETKVLPAQRFQTEQKLGPRFNALESADTRQALGREQVGEAPSKLSSSSTMPLLKRRVTSNRSEAESPSREKQREAPKMGRGMLDIRRFYRERKELERQREQEQKRRKQEAVALNSEQALPLQHRHSPEEVKTLAFLPSALKNEGDLDFVKLAHGLLRAECPGDHFIPRKTGWVQASNQVLLLQFTKYFDFTQNYGRARASERSDLERVASLLRLTKFSFHKQYQAEERKLARFLTTALPFRQSAKNSDLAHFLKSRSRLVANLLVPCFMRPTRPIVGEISPSTFGQAADQAISHRLQEFWISEYSKFLHQRLAPKSLYFVERQRGARSRRPSFAPDSFIKVDSAEENLIHQVESTPGIEVLPNQPDQHQHQQGQRMARISTAAEIRIRISGTEVARSGGVARGGSVQMLAPSRKGGERLLPLEEQTAGRVLQREFLKVFDNTIFLLELVYDGHFEIRVYQTDSLVLTLLPPRVLFDHQLEHCLQSPVCPETPRAFLALLREGFRFDSFNYDLILEKAARSLLNTEVDIEWMLGRCLSFYRQAPRYARNLLFFKALDLALPSALPFLEPEAILFFRSECVTRFGYSFHSPSGFLYKTLVTRDSAHPPEVSLLFGSDTLYSGGISHPPDRFHRSLFRPPPARLLETEEHQQENKEHLRSPSPSPPPASPFLGLARHSHGAGGEAALYEEGDTFAPRFFAPQSSSGPSFPGSRKVSQEERPLLAEKVMLMFKLLQEGESDIGEEFQLQPEVERVGGGEGRALRLRYFLLFLNQSEKTSSKPATTAGETSASRFPAQRIAEMCLQVEQVLGSTLGALKDGFERAKVWSAHSRLTKLSLIGYQEISHVSNVRSLSFFDPFFKRVAHQLRASVQFWRYIKVRFRGRCSEFTSEPRSSYVRPHFYNAEAQSIESETSSIQTAPEFTVLFPGELHILGIACFSQNEGADFFVVLEVSGQLTQTNEASSSSRKQIQGRLVRKLGESEDVPLSREERGLVGEVRNAVLYYLWLKSTTNSGEKFLESLKRHTKQF